MKLFFPVLFIKFILFLNLSFAQVNIIENFAYNHGDSLGAHGWFANTGGATNRLTVTSPGLTYTGYTLSNIGLSTTLANTGQDAFKELYSKDSANSFYASFMLRVDSARTGDYFLAFLPTNSTTNYSGRVLARRINGILNFGITKGNASSDTSVAGIWTTAGYSLGTTYLLILKYTFVPGTTSNDQVSLFVYSGAIPPTEPTPTVGPITYSSTDASSIGRIALRQGTASRSPNVIVDGIKVARNWESLIGSTNTTVTFTSLDLFISSIDLPIPGGPSTGPITVSLCSTCVVPSGSWSCDYKEGVFYQPVTIDFPLLDSMGLPPLNTVFVGPGKDNPYIDSNLVWIDVGIGEVPGAGEFYAVNRKKPHPKKWSNCKHGTSIAGGFTDLTPVEYNQFGGSAFFRTAISTADSLLRNLDSGVPAISSSVLDSINSIYESDLSVEIVVYFIQSGEYRIAQLDGSYSAELGDYHSAVSVLNLTSMIEGFYDPLMNFMVNDTMRVYLRNNTSPYALVDSGIVFLSSSGTGSVAFANAVNGVNYYIQLKHRNSIETWSKSPGASFTSFGLNFDFTTSDVQAFGNNMKLVGSEYCIYSGDINQDGVVDLTDIVECFNDGSNFVSGYVRTDLNGDNFVDLSDLTIAFNNSNSFVSKITP